MALITYSKSILTGASGGKPILITAIAEEAGNVIHTAVAATTAHDELWLWAYNTATTARQFRLELGVTASIDEMYFTVPARDGMYLICPGLPLNDTTTVRGQATVSTDIKIVGYVNSIATG